MKALLYRRYGARDVMALETVPDPGEPGPGEVRVRVHASSINPVDAKVRRGELRMIAGRHFPKRPGLDFSGVVEALGEGVAAFKVGEAVFGAARGMSEGAFAERALVRAGAIARKPASLDHATAAGVVTVGVAALQVLRDMLGVQPGMAVLVNGCTGGVGLFALQLGRAAGARMVGVCGADGMALAREYGAAEVFDYRAGGVPAGMRHAALLELSGRLPFGAATALLAPDGRYVDFSPSPAGLVGGNIANLFRRRKHLFAMTAPRTADLEHLAHEMDAGRLRPAPTRVLPLDRFTEAFALAEGGGATGKVVVRIGDES